MSGYICGGCGCGYHSDYKDDCYFYKEEHDMGARIPWCGYEVRCEFRPLNECPKDCPNYISKSEAFSIVSKYVKEKNK